eukprot:1059702-Rhodomonas_salina.1
MQPDPIGGLQMQLANAVARPGSEAPTAPQRRFFSCACGCLDAFATVASGCLNRCCADRTAESLLRCTAAGRG